MTTPPVRDDTVPIRLKRRYVADGMVSVSWCDECRSFVTRKPMVNPSHSGVEIVTLMDCPDPLDSNDVFHWECWFCGFSKLPSEWGTFFGVPTQPTATVTFGDGTPLQRNLFSQT